MKNTLIKNVISNFELMDGQHFLDWFKENREYMLEKEKQQIIDFASKCQLVRDVDCDGNVTFCFDPKEQFGKTFNK